MPEISNHLSGILLHVIKYSPAMYMWTEGRGLGGHTWDRTTFTSWSMRTYCTSRHIVQDLFRHTIQVYTIVFIYTTYYTSISRNKMMYKVANGNSIPHRGERVLRGVTEDGTPFGFTSQVTDVTKTLCAVSKMADAGNRVVFGDESGDFIENKTTGKRTYMRRENGVYKITMWREYGAPGNGGNKGESGTAPFHRQGQ